MGGLKGLAIKHSGGDQLHDLPASTQILLDLIRSLFRPQVPGYVMAVADLVIRFQELDLASSTQLFADLFCSVFWLVLTVRRKLAPCSVTCQNGRPQPMLTAAASTPATHFELALVTHAWCIKSNLLEHPVSDTGNHFSGYGSFIDDR